MATAIPIRAAPIGITIVLPLQNWNSTSILISYFKLRTTGQFQKRSNMFIAPLTQFIENYHSQ